MFFNVVGAPVEVGVTMYVLSISSLSEVQMVSTFNNLLGIVNRKPIMGGHSG